MKRNQWILVGTAGVLSVGVISLGAMSIASALEVRDASGAEIAGAINGTADGTGGADVPAGTVALDAEKPGSEILAPSPTATPSATAPPTPSSAPVADVAPAPQPVPVLPVGSASAVSASSNG